MSARMGVIVNPAFCAIGFYLALGQREAEKTLLMLRAGAQRVIVFWMGGELSVAGLIVSL